MKRYFGERTGRVLAGVALLLGTGASVFADAQDFTIVNKTGFTISSLYASPVKAKNWGGDILGEGEMATGRTLEIKFSGYGEKVCRFDVMLKDENDKEWIVEDIDLCEIHSLSFSKKGNSVHYEAN